MKAYQSLCLFITCVLVMSCASSSSNRYSMKVDSAPIILIPDHEPSIIIPKHEPYRLANMRPYTINGTDYQPVLSGKGFVQTGIASWYGQKFHGHLTSNGEVFDMYEFTAAHTTLPLPSYVRVTNTDNSKQLIVRVNDRGPFHSNRIIDLSFAAAKELDYLTTGTAPVKIEVVHVDENNMVTIANNPAIPLSQFLDPSPVNIKPAIPAPAVTPQIFIQIAAFSDQTKAQSLAQAANIMYQHPTTVSKTQAIYRTLIGPIKNRTLADALILDVKGSGYNEAFIYIRS